MEGGVTVSGVCCCVTLSFVTLWVAGWSRFEMTPPENLKNLAANACESKHLPRWSVFEQQTYLFWSQLCTLTPWRGVMQSIEPCKNLICELTITAVNYLSLINFCQFFALTLHVAALHSQTKQAILWGSYIATMATVIRNSFYIAVCLSSLFSLSLSSLCSIPVEMAQPHSN